MDNYIFTLDKDNDSILVAKMINGNKKNDLIYLSKNSENPIEQEDKKIDALYNYVNDNHIRVSSKQIQTLEQSIQNNSLPENIMLRKILTNFENDFNQKSGDVYLKKESIECMPLNYIEGQRDSIYICGCAGSGKSTWISNYTRNFNNMFKGSPIFFISAKNLKDEKAYNDIKNIKQLDLNVEQLEDITSEGKAFEYFIGKKNSLVIFDDAEALSKEQQKYVDLILESILQIGRSKHIYCIISRHILNNGIKTKVIFNELNKLVVFPNGISRYQLNYTMKNYLGFDKYQIEKTLHTKSRWILIHNHLPRYVLGEKSLVLL